MRFGVDVASARVKPPFMFATPIPRMAALLTAAGALPFVWGVLTLLLPEAQSLTMEWAGPRFVGPFVLLSYGIIILSFMSGVLWGFATKAEGGTAALGYVLSVIPALWCFFMVGGGAVFAAVSLIAGFLGVLLIDWFFWNNGLAPDWWMALRIPVTAVVCLCLLAVVIL